MIINIIKGDWIIWIFTPGQALNLLLFSSRQKRSNGENLRVRSFPTVVVAIISIVWSCHGPSRDYLEGFNKP